MAAGNEDFWRKVRAPQGRVVANSDRGRPQGKCNRKYTAPKSSFELFGVRVKRRGKSSPVPMVTSGAWQTPPGARPNREAFEGCPPDASG